MHRGRTGLQMSWKQPARTDEPVATTEKVALRLGSTALITAVGQGGVKKHVQVVGI